MPRDRPLVTVFDLVTSVGGVQTVMADVLPLLTEQFRVAVIDAYRNPEYARLFSPSVVELVALGSAPQRRFIGGRSRLERAERLAKRAPWLVATGLRLRRWALSRRPAVIHFNQLPSLSFFSRFLPSGPAIVYYAHGFGCAADIHDGPYISRRCSRVLAVSHAVAELMSDAGVDRSKITVVHNGVDADDLRRKAHSGSAPLPPRAPGEFVVVQVAVLAPNKQQHLAIEALSHLPPGVVLWLCGDVPDGGDRAYVDRLRKRASQLGVQARVKFLGWRDDVPFVLAGADVAILPSVQEGLPRVLVEAMALGKPCIGTAVGGIPEVIAHGVTGWVTGIDPKALAAALARLVASPETRIAMGEAARRRAETLFTVARQARQVGDALEAVASGGRRGGGARSRRDDPVNADPARADPS